MKLETLKKYFELKTEIAYLKLMGIEIATTFENRLNGFINTYGNLTSVGIEFFENELSEIKSILSRNPQPLNSEEQRSNSINNSARFSDDIYKEIIGENNAPSSNIESLKYGNVYDSYMYALEQEEQKTKEMDLASLKWKHPKYDTIKSGFESSIKAGELKFYEQVRIYEKIFEIQYIIMKQIIAKSGSFSDYGSSDVFVDSKELLLFIYNVAIDFIRLKGSISTTQELNEKIKKLETEVIVYKCKNISDIIKLIIDLEEEKNKNPIDNKKEEKKKEYKFIRYLRKRRSLRIKYYYNLGKELEPVIDTSTLNSRYTLSKSFINDEGEAYSTFGILDSLGKYGLDFYEQLKSKIKKGELQFGEFDSNYRYYNRIKFSYTDLYFFYKIQKNMFVSADTKKALFRTFIFPTYSAFKKGLSNLSNTSSIAIDTTYEENGSLDIHLNNNSKNMERKYNFYIENGMLYSIEDFKVGNNSIAIEIQRTIVGDKIKQKISTYVNGILLKEIGKICSMEEEFEVDGTNLKIEDYYNKPCLNYFVFDEDYLEDKLNSGNIPLKYKNRIVIPSNYDKNNWFSYVDIISKESYCFTKKDENEYMELTDIYGNIFIKVFNSQDKSYIYYVDDILVDEEQYNTLRKLRRNIDISRYIIGENEFLKRKRVKPE